MKSQRLPRIQMYIGSKVTKMIGLDKSTDKDEYEKTVEGKTFLSSKDSAQIFKVERFGYRNRN